MNFLLVVAHPETRSFNFSLHQTALETLQGFGHQIKVSELYQQGFNPVAGQGDVTNWPEGEFFQLGKAQRRAMADQTFCPQIQIEQEKLVACDVVIMQFPLWWWSFPAIMKGWIDRVLTSGFAYGTGATLPPKKVLYSLTTGGASSPEEIEYYRGKITELYNDIFGFTGWETLPPFIAHGVQTISQKERKELLGDYQKYLASRFSS